MFYYGMLGVAQDTSPETIRSAYRKLAMRLWPNRHVCDQSVEAAFKVVNEAYGLLKSPAKRIAYDWALEPAEKVRPDPFVRAASTENLLRHTRAARAPVNANYKWEMSVK